MFVAEKGWKAGMGIGKDEGNAVVQKYGEDMEVVEEDKLGRRVEPHLEELKIEVVEVNGEMRMIAGEEKYEVERELKRIIVFVEENEPKLVLEGKYVMVDLSVVIVKEVLFLASCYFDHG